MRKFLWLLVFGVVMSLFTYSRAAELRGGVIAGHSGGLGWDINATAFNFAQGLPLAVRLSVGQSYFDPGNATETRKIFINNNQGGTPQESGSLLRFTFDFLYPVNLLNLKEIYIYGGSRYGRFTGNFKFIGSNEDFDVTSKQWGIGAGLESAFPMSSKIRFILNGGADYYFASTLYGHDTSYSHDGESTNPREDYQYSDADDAINQPKLEFRFMLGFSYKFGK